MKTAMQIRRERLLMLLAELGISLADMSERLGRSRRDSTLGQIINGALNSGTGKARGMGDNQARQLEEVFGKPTGWMDRDPEFDQLLQQLQKNEPPGQYTAWPFPRIDVERWYRLAAEDRQRIEAMVLAALELAERNPQPAGGGAATHREPRAAA